MDLATILGLVVGLGMILGGDMIEGGRISQIAQPTAAMIVIDAHNEIRHLTIESRVLLDELQTGGVTEAGLPSLVGAVVTRARFSRTSTQVATRVCGTSGRWLRGTVD